MKKRRGRDTIDNSIVISFNPGCRYYQQLFLSSSPPRTSSERLGVALSEGVRCTVDCSPAPPPPPPSLPSSSSGPVLHSPSASRFSLSSLVSLLKMSNDVVISVSLHLSMSDGKQECGLYLCVCVCEVLVGGG